MTEALADRRIPLGDDFLAQEELNSLTPEELIARTTALKPLVAERALSAEQNRKPINPRNLQLEDRAEVCLEVRLTRGL